MSVIDPSKPYIGGALLLAPEGLLPFVIAQAARAETAAVASAASEEEAFDQAGIATAQANIAAGLRADTEAARNAAGQSAGQAAASAAEANYLASMVGALSYDMGTLGAEADGSTTFDFGSL